MVKILKSNIWSYIKSKFENNPNNIQMDGIANVGVSDTIARSDHVHPRDSTKADTDHSHDAATNTESGFLSSNDKIKLDSIEDAANNYSHPSYSRKSLGLYKINVDDNGHVSQTGSVTLNDLQEIGVPINSGQEYSHPQHRSFAGKPETDKAPRFGDAVTISAVTTDDYGHVTQMFDREIKFPEAEVSQVNKGLMGSQDKIKLDNIEQNANKTTVDSRLSGTSNNPISNNAVVNALNAKADTSHNHSINDVSNLKSLLDAKSDNDHLHSNSRDRYQILLVKYDDSNNTFENEDNLRITIGNKKLACIVRNKWTGGLATDLSCSVFMMVNGQSYERTLHSGVSSGLDFNITEPVLVLARLKNGSDYNTSFDMKYVQK